MKFGFTYDPVNRLKKANFTQYSSANWDVSAGIDFTLKNMSYDANGNITSMSQNGLMLSTSSIIDSLTYGYIINTNRLKYVTDAANNPTSTLGDFKEVNNNTTQDYWYDGNGNLTKDNNKSISSISYNYLNLPQTITVTGKGTITYTYDAAGNKLKKVTVDNTVSGSKTTTTDYFGGFVYQNDTLQFLSQEEGRVRPATAGKTDTMYYDYFEKDHLGNIRVVLTDQKQQDVYPVATVESQNAAALAIEKQYFDIQDANIVDTSIISGFAQNTATYKNNNGNPPYNTNPSANTGQVSKKLYKLNGQQGVKTGLGITLRVMSGDVVDVYGKSYWHSNGLPIQNTYNISAALMNFLGLFAGSQAVNLGGHGTDATTLFNTPNTTVPLGNWLNNSVPDPGVNIPKAYINWILFDEQFKVISSSSGFSGVNTTGDVLKTHHNTVSIPKNGYLYVYCSNESNVDVYFDNLQVIHTRGPLIEETHYYPFGLTMAGISSKALNGSPENKRRFNKGSELQSKEFSDGSGIEFYTTNYRMLDPQIGRFWQVDPLADIAEDISPFAFASNNPILINDPFGLANDTAILPLVTVKVKLKKSQQSNNTMTYFIPPNNEISHADNTRVYHPIIGGLVLSTTTYLSAEIANQGFSQAPYPKDFYVRQFRQAKTELYVRVSNSIKGTVRGQWLVKASSIRGMTPQQIQQNLSLPEIPDQIGVVKVPEGTLMRAGPVGGNSFGSGNLGITQYQLMEPIPETNFFEPLPLISQSIELPVEIPLEPFELPEIPFIP